MNPLEIIKIDAVISVEQSVCGSTDILELEWFETNKRLIRRTSVQGFFLELEKQQRQKWNDGDSLWSNGSCIAVIRIKPCLAIKICTDDLQMLSDFCYYIGNRHLPVFIDSESNCLLVPYDGNLFDQLKAKFQNFILLEETQLLSENKLLNKNS